MTKNPAPVAVLGWGASSADADDARQRAYTGLMRRVTDAGPGAAIEVTAEEMELLRAQPVAAQPRPNFMAMVDELLHCADTLRWIADGKHEPDVAREFAARAERRVREFVRALDVRGAG